MAFRGVTVSEQRQRFSGRLPAERLPRFRAGRAVPTRSTILCPKSEAGGLGQPSVTYALRISCYPCLWTVPAVPRPRGRPSERAAPFARSPRYRRLDASFNANRRPVSSHLGQPRLGRVAAVPLQPHASRLFVGSRRDRGPRGSARLNDAFDARVAEESLTRPEGLLLGARDKRAVCGRPSLVGQPGRGFRRDRFLGRGLPE